MGAPSTSYVKQYQATITLLAQQMDSRLKGSVMVDNDWTGEEKYYDQYGTDEFVEITTRLADTPMQTGDHRRRKVTPRYFVSNTPEDPNEKMAMLIDPKSTYLQSKMAAANRKIDAIIISALGGTAYSGKTGATSNDLGADNKIAHGGAGLTKAKMIEAKRILDAFEIPGESRTAVCSAIQLNDDLLNTVEATSSDYHTVRALVQGDVDTWLGFKFEHSEQLSNDATPSRLCYAYQKFGVQLAIQRNPESRLSELPGKNYAWQVYMRLALGAVRLKEDYVVQIACNE